jgi:hypothetical protein
MPAKGSKRSASKSGATASTSKAKRQVREPAPITSTFIRNESIDWFDNSITRAPEEEVLKPLSSPVSDLSQAIPDSQDWEELPSEDPLPASDCNLKKQFADFLRKRMEVPDGLSISRAEELKKINKPLLSLRALALDPDSVIEGLNINAMTDWLADGDEFNLESFFAAKVLPSLKGQIIFLKKMWENEGATATRSYQDVRAQTDVKKDWYQEICVLARTPMRVEGGHIIDVAAKHQEPPLSIWGVLRMFFPLEKLATLEIDAEQNILPLNVDVHKAWDGHEFGLRPIKHAADPEEKLFLQVVVFKQLFVARNFTQEGSGNYLGLVDWNHDTSTPQCRAIQHGDLYLLSTTDPAQYPLPNFRYLQLRYSAQIILAAQKAAGWLDRFFRGPAPELALEIEELDDVLVPSDWEEELADAERRGTINRSKRKEWELAILEHEHRKVHDMLREEGVE